MIRELPLPPIPLREHERVVLWLDGDLLRIEMLRPGRDGLPPQGRIPWRRTAVSADVAQRLPVETARFLRATFDAAIADVERLG